MNSYNTILCLLSSPLIIIKSSFTNILGFLIVSNMEVGNSKLMLVDFPTPSSLILTSEINLKIPHSLASSLCMMLYSTAILAKFLKASFNSVLSFFFSQVRRFNIPRSVVKTLSSGVLFRLSFAIRNKAFITFLSCNVAILLICTIELCFLISK